MQQAFPMGIAAGESFCNRVAERKLLANNINNLRHTVLLGPRRYGKTSLITEVLRETNNKHAAIDLLLCGSINEVQNKLILKAGQLLQSIFAENEKIKTKIYLQFLLNLNQSYQFLTMALP